MLAWPGLAWLGLAGLGLAWLCPALLLGWLWSLSVSVSVSVCVFSALICSAQPPTIEFCWVRILTLKLRSCKILENPDLKMIKNTMFLEPFSEIIKKTLGF